jgi:transcriptional regulator with XRE-family HTH domain
MRSHDHLGFGYLLRQHRRGSGLTQEQLADRSGLSVRAIGDLERGRVIRPLTRTVQLLADSLMLAQLDREKFTRAALELPRDAPFAATASDAELSSAAAHSRVAPTAGSCGASVAVRQLPARVPCFAGRHEELAALDQLLTRSGRQAATLAKVAAISGTVGVGKTTLAVEWAHRRADHFPDGQLYVDMRGYSPAGCPVSEAEALDGFLAALGQPPGHCLGRAPERAALSRSMMSGRRILIVLDNVRDAEHARLLLPGAPGCVALVTSRSGLTGLVATHGARLVKLGLPGYSEARQLLIRRLGHSRITDDETATAALIDACARLPLALSIMGARALDHPQTRLADLVAEIRIGQQVRLDAFESTDPRSNLRTVMSWSCRTIGPKADTMFRLLGLHPGPDITVAAGASLAGAELTTARRAMQELANVGLLAESGMDRYAFHDLLRAFALDDAASDRPGKPDPIARQIAGRRLLDHYLWSAAAAAEFIGLGSIRLTPPALTSGVTAQAFRSQAGALEWLRAEHPAILSLIRTAAAAGEHEYARLLRQVITRFQELSDGCDERGQALQIA